MRPSLPTTLLITCGALAREVVELIRANRWTHMTVACLPAQWHNTPERIPEAVRDKIRKARERYDRIVVLYGDCGTGGMLDKVLEAEGVERIPGPHCYQFFAGTQAFEALHNAELGTLYLTDYLARHFDRIIIRDLGIDRHPELLEMYFGNYNRLVYLSQIEDTKLQRIAEAAAARLGLDYVYRFTGFGELGDFLDAAATVRNEETDGEVDDRLLA